MRGARLVTGNGLVRFSLQPLVNLFVGQWAAGVVIRPSADFEAGVADVFAGTANGCICRSTMCRAVTC
jgi:hypothetical protein